MKDCNTPAPAGKKVRALIVSALLVSIVAGALFVPVMAGSTNCNICSEPDEHGYQVCTMQYCPPVILPEPLPPCCVYGPHGEPYCFGLGRCRMDPGPFPGYEINDLAGE